MLLFFLSIYAKALTTEGGSTAPSEGPGLSEAEKYQAGLLPKKELERLSVQEGYALRPQNMSNTGQEDKYKSADDRITLLTIYVVEISEKVKEAESLWSIGVTEDISGNVAKGKEMKVKADLLLRSVLGERCPSTKRFMECVDGFEEWEHFYMLKTKSALAANQTAVNDLCTRDNEGRGMGPEGECIKVKTAAVANDIRGTDEHVFIIVPKYVDLKNASINGEQAVVHSMELGFKPEPMDVANLECSQLTVESGCVTAIYKRNGNGGLLFDAKRLAKERERYARFVQNYPGFAQSNWSAAVHGRPTDAMMQAFDDARKILIQKANEANSPITGATQSPDVRQATVDQVAGKKITEVRLSPTQIHATGDPVPQEGASEAAKKLQQFYDLDTE